MNEPRWLAPHEEAAWRGFVAMHLHLFGRIERELRRDSDLSDADYAVLVGLSEAEDDRLRIGELGEELAWEKGRLSKQLTRMEQRGLIVREPCPTDARGAFAVLTPAGRAAIEAAAPLHVEHIRRLFVEPLTHDQLDAMTGISRAILARLHSERLTEPD
jgi:DNA-binding MarR family transcriptional regulator